VHCSRVFRSSAPSDLLPSSPGRRPSGAAPGECGSTRSTEWGVGPGGEVSHRGCCPAGILPAGPILEGTCRGRSALRSGSHDAPSITGRTCSARRDATAAGAAPAGPASAGPVQSGPIRPGIWPPDWPAGPRDELPGPGDQAACLMAAWPAVSRGPAVGQRVTSPLSYLALSKFT
jgi:hypothetical protein